MAVELEINDAVAVIKLDDGKANAINQTGLSALNAAIDEAESAARAVVITGRDGLFSAGFDLKVMKGGSADEVGALVTEGARFLHRIAAHPLPFVAASTGHAVAMGLFVTLACDYRIGASGNFQYCANETQIGMPLPEFGFALVKTRVTPSSQMDVVGFSRAFSPDEAAAVGILNETRAPEDALPTALKKAQAFAALPEHAFSYNKRGIQKRLVDALAAGQA